MSIIEEIKRGLPHDEGCSVANHTFFADRDVNGNTGTCFVCGYTEASSCHDTKQTKCNCSRRRKIAWLERLEGPTEAQLYAMRDVCEKEFGNALYINGRILANLAKAALKAAEEDLP